MAALSLGILAALLLQAGPTEVSETLEPVEARPESVRAGLGVRLEVRSSGGPTTDLEVAPTAAIRLPFRNAALTLAYEPRIFIFAGPVTQHVAYVHRGRVDLSAQPNPRWNLFLRVLGGYGEYDFNPLSTVLPRAPPTTDQGGPSGTTSSAPSPTTTIPSISTIPNERLVKVVDLSATAGVTYSVTPRMSWLLSGGYLRSGGVGAAAEEVLPLQQGPTGSTGPRFVLSPTDALEVLLSGWRTEFSNGPAATIVNLTGTWSHAFSRTWQADLVGGAGAFHSTGPDRPVNDSVLPVAGLALTHVWLLPRGNILNTLQLGAAPQPDAISGVVYERLNAALINSVPLGSRVWFSITGGVSVTVGNPQRDIRVESMLSWVISPQVSVSGGARLAWLRGSDLLGSTGFGWTGFLAVSINPLGTTL